MTCPVCRTRELEQDETECSTCRDLDFDGMPYDDGPHDPLGPLERLPYYDA